MKYRDIEYAVIQERDSDAWRWTVDLNEATAESGQRKTREAALTAVVLTIDRWFARPNRINASPVGDAEAGGPPG
jgi:hypothetical protein